MGFLTWWYEFLPRIVQDQLIGTEKVNNIQDYYIIYKKKVFFYNACFF